VPSQEYNVMPWHYSLLIPMNMDYPEVSWRIAQRSLCLNTDIDKAIIDLRNAKI
jgi:hypothetical protein